jgi:hypothetical protein
MTTTLRRGAGQGRGAGLAALGGRHALDDRRSSRPLEDAWRIGQVELVRWFGELYGLHPMDAYQLLSQITEVPIANVVDANYSTVVKARQVAAAPGRRLRRLHDDLRRRAAALL